MNAQTTFTYGGSGTAPRLGWTAPATPAAPTIDADTPHDKKSALVESSSLGYRAGMTTEVRIAPKWGNAVSGYLRYLRAIDQSEKTIYLRGYQLRIVSQAFRGRSPWSLTGTDLESYLATLTTLGRSAKRSQQAALRGFYKYGLRHGYVKSDPTLYIKTIPKVNGVPRPASDADIRAALDRADPRTKLMIELGAYCGLRRAEIAAVHTDDVRPDAGGRFALRVKGKGGRVRMVPLTPYMAAKITDHDPGYLFPSWHRGQEGSDGRTVARPLSAAHVAVLIREVLPPGVTTHMLRHRFASVAYGAGHDIRAVQMLLGHASVATTQTYTAVEDDSIYAGVAAAGALTT